MARLTYKSAGVDIALKERLVPLFRWIARPTLGANVIGGVGGFGALIGLDGVTRMRSPVLVAGADGVGTKLKIAFATGRHDTIGIDCVAMCVNDIICHNARPLFFLRLHRPAAGSTRTWWSRLSKGSRADALLRGPSLVGGETGADAGLYEAGENDPRVRGGRSPQRSAHPRPTAMRR